MNDRCQLCGASVSRDVEENIKVEGSGTITLHYAACDECGAELNPCDDKLIVIDLYG